jgi:stress response protein SCP2
MANPITALPTGANTILAQEKMLEVTIEWMDSPANLDASCFMIHANGKVPSDDYFIFYNQPADPGSLVEYKGTGDNNAVFSINLEGLLATEIEKCVFAVTLDGLGTFKSVNGCKITARTSHADAVFEVKEASDETSLVLMELYRNQAWWKVRAIGKGFNGGLQPLAEAHGVSVAEEEDEPASPAPAAASAASSSAAAAMPVAAPAAEVAGARGIPAAAGSAVTVEAGVPSAAASARPAALIDATAQAAAPTGAKQASVFASQRTANSVFASQQKSASVFASLRASASVFALQQKSASVFISLQPSDSVFASQPKQV